MHEDFNDTDKVLLERIALGNEDAFRELFNTYRPKLYSYIFRITESREMAEDAVQDIFLKIWNRRETLPEIDNMHGYLYRMAQNDAYTGFKRLAKETLVLAELKREQPTVQVDPGQELVSQEIRAYIRSVVDQLTPQQKRVFLLSREGGLKQEEIARELNISIFSVKKHMVDALRHLRGEISKNYGALAIAILIIYNLTTS